MPSEEGGASSIRMASGFGISVVERRFDYPAESSFRNEESMSSGATRDDPFTAFSRCALLCVLGLYLLAVLKVAWVYRRRSVSVFLSDAVEFLVAAGIDIHLNFWL